MSLGDRALLPERHPDPLGGRPRVDDGVCFGAIVFVLFTGNRPAAEPRRRIRQQVSAHFE